MTDDRSTATQSPAELPLGIQQPLLSAMPLGQSMLQPKFFTPLGARSLRVLDPSIFLAVPDLSLPNQESLNQELPFQDSPFFDAPDFSTPSKSTVPTVQTQPQPRSLKPAPSEINVPTTAPFERIAETPIIETSTVEDLAIAEPLIARSPLADLDTPIVEASTVETLIARTFAVETPIAEDLAIAEPLIARSPIVEPDTAIASPFVVEETTTEAIPSAPSEVAAIAQNPQSEPLNRFESPSPSISRLSTETLTETPAEHSIEPSISNVSAQDFDPPTETANEYPEALLLERSPFSPDTVVTHTSTQPPDSAAIQRTTNLEDSASPIAPISAENMITPVVTDLTSIDADSAEPIQPKFDSTDNIPSLAPASEPEIASLSPVNHSEMIATSTSAIAQPILDSPAALARLPEDELIDPVIDVAKSVVQSASDRDNPVNQAEETSLPASLVGERQTEVARLGNPQANVDISSTAESISEETIQRSPLEPAISEPAMSDREDDTVAAIAAPPVDSPISDVEGIQPKTTNLVEQKINYAT